MTGYIIAAALALAVYILARTLKAALQRVRAAEAEKNAAVTAYNAAKAELRAREEDRHALEAELSRLRSGSPQSRLDASLDVLHDEAEHTGASSDHVADSPAPARDGN